VGESREDEPGSSGADSPQGTLDGAPSGLEAVWQWQSPAGAEPPEAGQAPSHAASPSHSNAQWQNPGWARPDDPVYAVNAGLSNIGCATMGLLGAAFILALAAQIACWVMHFRFP